MRPPAEVRRAQWRGAVLTVVWLFVLLWALLTGVMVVTP
jgi:hypothetical protein